MSISREEIISAAEELLANTGQPPSNSQVRGKLGTGSIATISPVLREWRKSLTPSFVAACLIGPIPQPVVASLLSVAPQIWSIACRSANELLAAERTKWATERTDLKAALSGLKTIKSRAEADLQAAEAKIDELATDLNEQIAVRDAAEHAVEVLRVTNNQMQICIDNLHTELNVQIATHNVALAKQTEATHEAEQRASAAEASAVSLSFQVYELEATIEQLLAHSNAPVPIETKIKT